MKTRHRTFCISILGLLIVFLGLGLTTNNAVKNEKEYTEVLHFTYAYLPDGTPSYDIEYNEIGSQPIWLLDDLPNELNPNLASELFHIGYKRSEVRKRDFAELDAIFSCEPIDKKVMTDCFPIYRDLLIFRNAKRVIKIVQLCFDCNKAHFVGPWENVGAFGQRGEYEKLKALLDK